MVIRVTVNLGGLETTDAAVTGYYYSYGLRC